MSEEIRNPKSEIRKKPEARNPKGPAGRWNSAFGLRISAFFRISDLGFRIYGREIVGSPWDCEL